MDLITWVTRRFRPISETRKDFFCRTLGRPLIENLRWLCEREFKRCWWWWCWFRCKPLAVAARLKPRRSECWMLNMCFMFDKRLLNVLTYIGHDWWFFQSPWLMFEIRGIQRLWRFGDTGLIQYLKMYVYLNWILWEKA